MVQTQTNPTQTWCKPKNPSSINGENLVQTCFVQVPLQLHRSLHLHVVLEDAAAKRGLVVGLPSQGLDGRFHPGLRHAGGDDLDAPHCFVDFLRWHSNLDTVGIPTGLRVGPAKCRRSQDICHPITMLNGSMMAKKGYLTHH